MPLNIPSSILIDAIKFVKTHPKTANWFESRDNSHQMSVKSIKSEVYSVNKRTRTIYIRIYVDYVEQTPYVGQIEDLIIDLAWRKGVFVMGPGGAVAGF